MMILKEAPMYPQDRAQLFGACTDGIAQLLGDVVNQRVEAHRLTLDTQFMVNASVAGANFILAGMIDCEQRLAHHRLRAGELVQRGGPDEYAEQVVFASLELDQFLFGVRQTRAHLVQMAHSQQPSLHSPAPAQGGSMPAGSPLPVSSEYQKLLHELQREEAKAAAAAQKRSTEISRKIALDRASQAASHAAELRKLL